MRALKRQIIECTRALTRLEEQLARSEEPGDLAAAEMLVELGKLTARVEKLHARLRPAKK